MLDVWHAFGISVHSSFAPARRKKLFPAPFFMTTAARNEPNQLLVRISKAHTMRRSRYRQVEPEPAETREQALLRRARRHRRRGEHRKAMLALREACYSSDSDARLWTLYAMSCVRAGRSGDGAQALRQALWLRERVRDDARARVTRGLIDRFDELEAA